MVADGRLLLATPVNPIFLLLPLLQKQERLVPLDQLLEDSDFPLTEEVLGATKGLEVVADSKGTADLNVWKYNSSLCLAWLEARVGRVAAVLQQQGIDLSQGAKSLHYRAAGEKEATTGNTGYRAIRSHCVQRTTDVWPWASCQSISVLASRRSWRVSWESR